MAHQICPKCGSIIEDTDTHCMDCGTEIAAARRQMSEKIKIDREGIAVSSQPQAVVGAAAGLADVGETSEKVRLKEFDKHLAGTLSRERGAVVLTAIIGLVIGAVVLWLGLQSLKNAGGIEAIRELDFGDLRSKGLGAFGDPTFISILVILTGVAGLMCAVGQTRRFMLAGRAIAQIKRSERPDVVHISAWTWMGLLLASVTVAPLGLILGIMFTMGKDEDTKALAGSMIKVSAVVMGLVFLDVVWDLVGGFAASQTPPTPVAPGAGAAATGN